MTCLRDHARCLAATLVVVCLGTVARADEPIEPPVLTRFVQATLPPTAPKQDALVVLILTIGADGAVTDVEVKQGAGEPWDSAASDAARAFEFEPARLGGKAVAVRVPFEYRFTVPKERGRFVAARSLRRALEPTPGARVAGTVLEKGLRTPLFGALIRATDPETGVTVEAVSRDDGSFELQGLSPGSKNITVITGGYANAVRGVVVAAAPRTAPPEQLEPFYLEPEGGPGYRTVIRGVEKPRAASEVTLTDVELTQTPGTFGDPTRVVATLPGVSRSPFGLGYYVVRGASFDNTGFFIDGHPALFLYHLLGGPAVIHPALVGELHFYPGGYPADLGRFAAGAIALDTAEPPRDRWHLDVEVDVLKASILGSVPFDDGKGSVTAAFRRSYFELLLPLVIDDVSLSYTDYQLRVAWDPSRRVRLLLLALGAEDAFESGSTENEIGNSTQQSVGLGFHRVMAAVHWDITPELTWSTSTAFEYEHTTGKRVSEDDDTLTVDLDGYFVQVRSWATWTPLDGYELRAGVDGLYSLLKADLVAPTIPPLGDPRPPLFDPIAIGLQFDGPYLSIAPFIGAEWEALPGLLFLPGVRFGIDEYAGRTRLYVDPKLAVRWQVHPAWTLKAMAALAHQPPQVFQTEDPYGDPTIPPVRGFQTSLGVEWAPADDWEVSVEGFVNLLSDIARPNTTFKDVDGKLERTSFSSDVTGRAFGLEVLIRKRIGDWVYGWLSYTLSRSEREFPPADYTLATLDQTHVLNLAWTFVLGEGWSIGSRFTLTSGTPYYPVVGARYDADRDRHQPIFATESSRLPVFHRLDLRVDKTWLFDTFILGVYVDVQNVYNQMNPESQRYSFDYRVRTDGVGLPILPTLGVKAAF